jgi:hypothetical protein
VPKEDDRAEGLGGICRPLRELADDQFITTRVLEPQDVSVLFIAALAIAERGLLSGGEPADRGLHELGNAAASLRRLSWTGLLTVKREHDRRWRVSSGDRALEIARKAGVEKVPSVLHEPVEEILTGS